MERLTLGEAISHAKEVAKAKHSEATYATYNFPDLKHYYDNCLECAEQHEQFAKWLEELKSYKDAEEQGLLVRLPCKFGDILYCIDNGIVETLIVNGFGIYNFNRVEIDFENASGFTLCTFSGELDEGYFLTREEAEKKLEEIKHEV